MQHRGHATFFSCPSVGTCKKPVDDLEECGRQVAVFEDPNFNNNMAFPRGQSRDCVVLRGGEPFYPNHTGNPTKEQRGGAYGLNTDVITSVRVGPSGTIQLFEHPNFTGASILLTSNAPNLSLLSPNLNDKTSSIRVLF